MSDHTPGLLQGKPILQVGIVVQDIESSAREWARLLGQPQPEIITTDSWERARTEYHGRRTDAQARLAFFRLGPLVLELIEPIGEPSTWQEHLAAHGGGLHHLAFEIKDMASQLSAFQALGVPLIQRGEYSGGRYAYIDGRQLLGTTIELLESDAKG